MDETWLTVIIVVWLVEWAFVIILPQHYARLAVIPLMRREEPLVRPRVAGATYRDAPDMTLSVQSLGLDGLRYEDDETTGGFEGGRGWLRARYKMFGWNRAMGVVAIRSWVEGETLFSDARLSPAFAVGGAVFAVGYATSFPGPFAAFVALVMVATYGYTTFMLRRRVQHSTSLCLDAIELRAAETLRKMTS